MHSIQQQELESLRERIPSLINLSRITIILSLLVFQIFSINLHGIHAAHFPPLQFYGWISIYAVLIVLTIFRPSWQWQTLDLPNASAVVDISMIMILVYIAGGIGSGFGILLLPFVATSCLLSYGHYPFIYASYAATLIGLNLSLESPQSAWSSHNLQAAFLLTAACYLVAFLTSFSAKHLQKATESANSHQQAYQRVRGLNRLVFNRVQEAIIVIDAQHRVLLFNKQAKTFFPSLAVEQEEMGFSELVARWQCQPNKPFEADIQIFQHAMHVRAVPLIQEETELLILYVRSLREIAAEAMATKLTSLGLLTANLAHEIRNPMSAIRHANDLLQDEYEDDPIKSKLHHIIDSNIQRIDKMLEEVSLLNKRDSTNREPIDLMQFWLNFKQEFTLNNPNAMNCLHLNMHGNNLTVLADQMHLQQIMWNLCNNAWRHSCQDANAITVFIRPSGHSHISIVVADNGPGVPPEVREHLFEPFFTTSKQGTGLGLYVGRELAHANLGQLNYHPEMNGFELVLPKEENE